MKEIDTHKIAEAPSAVRVFAADEAVGGVNFHYEFSLTKPGERESRATFHIRFQKGPLEEAGPNGITDESVVAVILDRLKSAGISANEHLLQAGTHLEQALFHLKERAKERAVLDAEKRRKKEEERLRKAQEDAGM